MSVAGCQARNHPRHASTRRLSLPSVPSLRVLGDWAFRGALLAIAVAVFFTWLIGTGRGGS